MLAYKCPSARRIVEVAGGSVVLDGIDIAGIGLRDLRGSLSFVAQDPVVFSGSVRKNLDPMGTCSNAAIGTALQQAGLQEWAAGLEVRLSCLRSCCLRCHHVYKTSSKPSYVLTCSGHRPGACRGGWILSWLRAARP